MAAMATVYRYCAFKNSFYSSLLNVQYCKCQVWPEYFKYLMDKGDLEILLMGGSQTSIRSH